MLRQADTRAADALHRVLRRDRLVAGMVLGALTVSLTALSWAQMASSSDLPTSSGERLMPCCGARFDVALLMWVVMMAGMMIPSVAPMVLAHGAIVRRRAAQEVPFLSSGLFLVGYLLAWTAFSAVAAFVQWVLYRVALLDGRSLSLAPWAGCVVLAAAGVFQLSSRKDACLSQCRSPVGFFLTEWREGRLGAVKMGVRHGVLCVGCCWLLMAILFAVGIMNIVWGAAITAFVLAEKTLPWRRVVVWTGGALCMAGASALLWRAVLGE